MTMIIDTEQKDLNPGTFFPFEEALPEGGGITVRIMNNEALDQMTKVSRQKRVAYHSAGRGQPEQRFEYFDVDEGKEFNLMWDYCIVDWTGIVDSNKNMIDCTTENKLRFMKEHIEFIRFVTNCQRRINQQIATEAENDTKNLLTPQEDMSGQPLAKTAESSTD